jgi:hypothetical protein
MQKIVVKDGKGDAEIAASPAGQTLACVAAPLPQAALARDEPEPAEDDASDELPDRHSPLLVPFGLGQ